MTVKEAQDLSIDEFKALSPAQQKNAVQVLADAYNKRIRRLERSEGGKGSPAYQSKVTGIAEQGKFSTKGKTGRELQAEFTRAQYFGKLKTSTVSGYHEYEATITAHLQDKQHGGHLSKSLANSAWDAFNKAKEQYPTAIADKSTGSDQLVKFLSNEVIGDKKYNTFANGELENIVMDKAREIYEASQNTSEPVSIPEPDNSSQASEWMSPESAGVYDNPFEKK